MSSSEQQQSVAAETKQVSPSIIQSKHTHCVNFASAQLGAEVLHVTNEAFAPARCLLQPGRGVFDPDTFTVVGKEMDGWESDRHAELKRGGSDFVIIRLAAAINIISFDIDTNHFTGNFFEYAKVEACNVSERTPWGELLDDAKWTEVLAKTKLKGGDQEQGGHNILPCSKPDQVFTHVRLHAYPDGGIARFKVFGHAKPNWEKLLQDDAVIDLAAMKVGGEIVTCNNAFYNTPNSLLKPWTSLNMGDGWESRRSRGFTKETYLQQSDWVVVQLAAPAYVSAIDVDTSHFVNNYPYTFNIQYVNIPDAFEPPQQDTQTWNWQPLVENTQGKGHFQHYLTDLKAPKDTVITHVRLSVFPDGGVSRLRVYGRPAPL